MNPRYTDPVVEAIWSRSNQLNLWVVIECSWLRTHSTSAYQDAASAPVPTPEQVMALEEATRHEFVAFLTAWIPGFCTSEAKQWVHYGLTSSDVIDTATAMQLCETATYLEARAADLRAAIQSAESEIVDLIQVGRTHGQWAQPRPVTVGFRTLRQMLERQTERHRLAARDLAYADFSGATGGRELIRAASVHRVLDGLGLRRAGSSTQILPRDGWAHWAHTVAGLVTVCEAIADQYWLLAQSDVGEVSVANGAGSSAMPHKASNPHLAENVRGLARMARGWASTIDESMVQRGDRDLAHSSVERVVLPDLSNLAATAIARTIRIVQDYQFDPERIRANLLTATSAKADSALRAAELVRSGASRSDAIEETRKENP